MFVWDYKVADSWEPKTNQEWRWFLVRKINYGEFGGLEKVIVKKHFPLIKRELDPGKRMMIEDFLENGIK